MVAARKFFDATARASAIVLAVFAIALADGPARLVRDLTVGPGSSDPNALVDLNGVLLFTTQSGEQAGQLWRSDGTADGTRLVAPIRVGRDVVVLGGDAFFAGSDGGGHEQLWKSDGTPEGTNVVEDLGEASIDSLVGLEGKLFFMVASGSASQEPPDVHDRLWRSDETPEGTVALADLGTYVPGPFGESAAITSLIAFNHLLLAVRQHFSECCLSASVLRVDQQTGQTVTLFLRTRYPPLTFFSLPNGFTAFGDGLFFTMADSYGTPNCELWRTDGSDLGTAQIEAPDLSPGCGFNALASVGTAVLFPHYQASGAVLWRVESSGLDPRRISLVGDDISGLVAIDDAALFFGRHSNQAEPFSLWRSDGTTAGTRPVRSIPGALMPAGVTAVGDDVVFVAHDAPVRPTLWRSDGTTEGTVELGPVPGDGGAPASFLRSGNDLFFAADDGEHGAELWAVPLRTIADPCAADCDGNGGIASDEIAAAVGIALGDLSAPTCELADFNGDGGVTVDEIVNAVKAAGSQCREAEAA